MARYFAGRLADRVLRPRSLARRSGAAHSPRQRAGGYALRARSSVLISRRRRRRPRVWRASRAWRRSRRRRNRDAVPAFAGGRDHHRDPVDAVGPRSAELSGHRPARSRLRVSCLAEREPHHRHPRDDGRCSRPCDHVLHVRPRSARRWFAKPYRPAREARDGRRARSSRAMIATTPACGPPRRARGDARRAGGGVDWVGRAEAHGCRRSPTSPPDRRIPRVAALLRCACRMEAT